MSQPIIIRSSKSDIDSVQKPTATFTGEVYMEKIHADPGKIMMGHVTFTPCARTYWHTHEHGQVLRVLAGSGWVCNTGGEPQPLRTGDMVWAPAGTTHWHGADDGSIMTHLAISLGTTSWHDEVKDDEYNKKRK